MLEPRAREVMAGLTVAVGRPMVYDLRAMYDAMSYAANNGAEWRALPTDFPPWEARWPRGQHPPSAKRSARGASTAVSTAGSSNAATGPSDSALT
jgi:transposase